MTQGTYYIALYDDLSTAFVGVGKLYGFFIINLLFFLRVALFKSNNVHFHSLILVVHRNNLKQTIQFCYFENWHSFSQSDEREKCCAHVSGAAMYFITRQRLL